MRWKTSWLWIITGRFYRFYIVTYINCSCLTYCPCRTMPSPVLRCVVSSWSCCYSVSWTEVVSWDQVKDELVMNHRRMVLQVYMRCSGAISRNVLHFNRSVDWTMVRGVSSWICRRSKLSSVSLRRLAHVSGVCCLSEPMVEYTDLIFWTLYRPIIIY